MQPAADKLAVMLETIEFSAPTIPVINNVDVATPTEPQAIKLALVKQLYSPVRWTETVLELAKQDVSSLYEIGPGKVLTGLVKRIDKNINGDALNTLASLTAQA
jgi:[acyl-carrier-protein] S-malonyltransferase